MDEDIDIVTADGVMNTFVARPPETPWPRAATRGMRIGWGSG